MTFYPGTPVAVTATCFPKDSVAMRGSQWIVREHVSENAVRCWRTYDWFKGDEIIEAYEEADIPPSHLERIYGGERDDF